MAKGILKKGKLVMVLAAIGSCLCLIGCAAKEDATEAVNYASEDSSLTSLLRIANRIVQQTHQNISDLAVVVFHA